VGSRALVVHRRSRQPQDRRLAVPLAGMSYTDASPPRPLRLLPEGLDRKWPERRGLRLTAAAQAFSPNGQNCVLVPGCEGEVSCRSLCFSHERSWRRTTLSVDEFIVRARPLGRTSRARWRMRPPERLPSPLCAFHDNRLRHHRPDLKSITVDDLATWVAGERPGQCCTSSLWRGSPSRALRAALCPAASDEMPPPLDPVQVWILITAWKGPAACAGPIPTRSARPAVVNTTRRYEVSSATFAAISIALSRYTAVLTLCRRPLGGSAAGSSDQRGTPLARPTGNRRLRRYRSPLAS